jgi:hypothetical protein
MRGLAERSPVGEMDESTRNRIRTAPINMQRASRILRTCVVPDRVRALINGFQSPQVWMVLTEPWCGDSAQSLPYIARMAECSEKILLRILLRDANPEVMDRYLTDGTRGIPKLVVFDEGGGELFRWGPRPRRGQEIFLQARAEGLEKKAALERLHLWYARDKGAEIEHELIDLLTGVARPDAWPIGGAGRP